MPAQPLATVLHDGAPAPRGLPIGDLRGFGRVGDDASIACLALDRARGPLQPSHPDRALLALHMDGPVEWTAAYVPGTQVLETAGRMATGEVRVVDFMPLAEGRPGQGESVPAGRFVRLVSCTEGEVAFGLVCAVAVDAAPALEARTVDGWYVACSRPMDFADELAVTHVRLAAGESMAIVLAAAPVDGGAALIADTLHGLGDTIHYWTWWSDRCRYKGPDFEERLREVLALKLCCVPGGGIVGEHPGTGGFAAAPLVECSRAAARFLDLGYRQECVDLLNHVHGQRSAVDQVSWASDDGFADTLARYVERYGDAGLPEGLRQAVTSPDTPLQQRAV